MLIIQYKSVYILQKFHINLQDLLRDANLSFAFQCKYFSKAYVHNKLQNLQKTFHHLEF